MKLESDGILVGLRPIGERDSVARIFTREYGVVCGVMRGAVVARKNRPLVGQMGAVTWVARLDSQLGTFHWDSERNLVAPMMMAADALAVLNCVFDLISILLPERERYDVLFENTLDWIQKLSVVPDKMAHYLGWEVDFLRELGYALDLSRCSGCGTCDNLHYLSPRTGRAVCDKCAAPYIGRLYSLPLTCAVTFRFLDALCANQGANMPLSRRMLERLNRG